MTLTVLREFQMIPHVDAFSHPGHEITIALPMVDFPTFDLIGVNLVLAKNITFIVNGRYPRLLFLLYNFDNNSDSTNLMEMESLILETLFLLLPLIARL